MIDEPLWNVGARSEPLGKGQNILAVGMHQPLLAKYQRELLGSHLKMALLSQNNTFAHLILYCHNGIAFPRTLFCFFFVLWSSYIIPYGVDERHVCYRCVTR